MKKVAVFIQVLTVTALGAFGGAMLMLYTAILSFWKKTTARYFLEWYDAYASGIMNTTGPLVMSSIILPLICFFLVMRNKQSRIYWLASFLLSVIIIIITLSYFVDVNTSFANQSIAKNNIKETLDTWGRLHIVRISLAFISTILGGFGMMKHLSKTNLITK